MADRIGAWLAAWASAVVARPRLAAAATLALGALAGWYAAGNLGVNTDTANMIAATIPWRQHYNEYRDAFPLRDRNLLIVIDAPTPARADEFAASCCASCARSPSATIRRCSPAKASSSSATVSCICRRPSSLRSTDRLGRGAAADRIARERLDGAAVLDVARTTLDGRERRRHGGARLLL